MGKKRTGLFGSVFKQNEPEQEAQENQTDEGQTLAQQVSSDEGILSDTPAEAISNEEAAPEPAPEPTENASEQPELLVKYTDNLAQEIGYSTDGSAGIDLRCHMHGCRGRGTRLAAGVVTIFDTGISVAIPKGYVGLIVMRSSKSAHDGILLANQVAVIDSDFRGEVKLPLTTNRPQGAYVSNGERVAQLLIVPCHTAKITKTQDIGKVNGKEYIGELEILGYDTLGIRVVNELPATERGAGGFGSTGKY